MNDTQKRDASEYLEENANFFLGLADESAVIHSEVDVKIISGLFVRLSRWNSGILAVVLTHLTRIVRRDAYSRVQLNRCSQEFLCILTDAIDILEVSLHPDPSLVRSDVTRDRFLALVAFYRAQYSAGGPVGREFFCKAFPTLFCFKNFLLRLILVGLQCRAELVTGLSGLLCTLFDGDEEDENTFNQYFTLCFKLLKPGGMIHCLVIELIASSVNLRIGTVFRRFDSAPSFNMLRVCGS